MIFHNSKIIFHLSHETLIIKHTKSKLQQKVNTNIVFLEIKIFINKEKLKMRKRQIKSKHTKDENKFSVDSHFKVLPN